MPVTPLDLAGDEKLIPPRPKFVIGEASSDAPIDANRVSQHSRTTSANTFHESPPITPRSLTFNTNHNSFTALNSQSFYINDQTPSTAPAMNNNSSGYPFPDVGNGNSNSSAFPSGVSSVASVADFSSRNTSSPYGSRPGTGTGYGSSPRPSSARSREAFASPRTRPLTMYSTVQPSITKIERDRPKSTMLVPTSSLQKPWLQERDPYQRISYFITYGVMFLGIAAGVIRCYFGFKDVPMLPGNLCSVLDESFDSEDGLFGDNGKFFREVDMSGFGCACFLICFLMIADENSCKVTENSK